MPEYFIRRQFGRSPEEVFSRVGFSGDHSRTVQVVQSGAYEVGVLDFTVWDLDKKAGKIDEAQVQVIWETPTYPDYNWTVRGDVDRMYGTGFKEKLRAALLAIEDRRHPRSVRPLEIHSRQEFRLRTDRGGRQGHRTC